MRLTDNMSALDILTVYSLMLQEMNYVRDMKSASTDDLMAELQKQDQQYFEQIIKNQKLILDKLALLVD